MDSSHLCPRTGSVVSDRRTGRVGWIGAVVAVVLVISGCSRVPSSARSDQTGSTSGVQSTPTFPVGSSSQSVAIGGTQRTFELYRPASVSGRSAVPLVVMLHGGFGSGSQAEHSYGWDAEADRHHFVVAYPNGEHHAWNVGGGCCGTPGATHVDDVTFITAAVADIRGHLSIDPDRLYVTGISNGGMMDYRLACDTSIFAAIGPDSATLLGTCPHPAPVSVIHIHGTADTHVPFEGGQGTGYAKIDGPPVPSAVAAWRKTDGCSAPTTAVSGPVTTSKAPCPAGRTVELITIAGAGHQWPGGMAKPIVQRILHLDPPSNALDATDTIWAFFAAHPKQPAG
jgi:polyhydroxybutyrate depolymerase